MARTKKYKVCVCRTCDRSEIVIAHAHASDCHGSRMKEFGELDQIPIAMIIEGKWIVGNLDIPRTNSKTFRKAQRYNNALRHYAICAVIPSILGVVDEINEDGFKSLIAARIRQVCADSLEPSYFQRRYSKDYQNIEINAMRNEARSMIFTPEFEHMCEYVGLKTDIVREDLISRWHRHDDAKVFSLEKV